MRTLLLAVTAGCLSALGCGTSTCQQVANTTNGVASRSSACLQGDGGTMTALQVTTTEVSQCNASCTSSGDTQALQALEACLNGLPACDPQNPGTFDMALASCFAQVAGLSASCQAVFNQSGNMGGDT